MHFDQFTAGGQGRFHHPVVSSVPFAVLTPPTTALFSITARTAFSQLSFSYTVYSLLWLFPLSIMLSALYLPVVV